MTAYLDIAKITELLPHRYPFLLVDKVLQCEPGERMLAIKNVSINEPFFQGHFPGLPVMPGVLIMEALAQTTALLTSQSDENCVSGTVYFLAGIDKARFKKQVVPGDRLELEAVLVNRKRHIWTFDCQARVDEQLAARAQIMCAASVPQ